MNSKEALRTIGNTATKFIKSDGIGRPRIYYSVREMKKKEINIIKQDLDRLEKLETANKNNEGLVRDNVKLINRNLELEKENQELKEKFKMLEENEEVVLTTLEMAVQENTKLKKALEKSCERLDYTCPVEEELIDDLDCENCDSNCKECWKKFFLKEVLGND